MPIRQALATERHRLSETGFEGERDGYRPAVERIGVARVAGNRDGGARTVEGIQPDRTGADGGGAVGDAAHTGLCRAGRAARGSGAKRRRDRRRRRGEGSWAGDGGGDGDLDGTT